MPRWASASRISPLRSTRGARGFHLARGARDVLEPSLGLGAHALGVGAGLADVGHEREQLLVAALEPFLGARDHALGDPEAPRDREGARLARHPDQDPVAGRERPGVELDARVLGARVAEGELLELADVRRGERRRAALEEELEHGLRERRAFVGIRPRAELVEQDERPSGRALDPGPDARQVRGERRQARADLLLVADVGHDPVEERDRRARRTREGHPAPHEERRQAGRLQRERLPARVRPRDHEHVEIPRQAQVDRDDLRETSQARLLEEQRVERGAQEQTGRGAGLAGQERDARARFRRPGGRRERELQAREPFSGVGEARSRGDDPARELEQDPLDLAPFLRGDLGQAVAERHDLARLDEERLAALRAIVDDPGDPPGAPRLHREDGPVAAAAGRRIRERGLHAGPLEDRAQGAVDAAPLVRGLRPQAREQRRGLAADPAALVEDALHLAPQRREIRHPVRERGASGQLARPGPEPVRDPLDRLEVLAQREERGLVERAPLGARAVDLRQRIGDAGEAGRGGRPAELDHLRRAAERGAGVVVGERRELAHRAASERRPDVALEDREHVGEVEGARGERLAGAFPVVTQLLVARHGRGSTRGVRYGGSPGVPPQARP
jgi:hypothetical protein